MYNMSIKIEEQSIFPSIATSPEKSPKQFHHTPSTTRSTHHKQLNLDHHQQCQFIMQYKQKSYKLMQKVVELEIKDRKNVAYIEELETRVQLMAGEMEKHIKNIQYRSKRQKQKNAQIMQTKPKIQDLPGDFQKQVRQIKNMNYKYRQIAFEAFNENAKYSSNLYQTSNKNKNLKNELIKKTEQNLQLKSLIQDMKHQIKHTQQKIKETEASYDLKLSQNVRRIERLEQQIVKIGQNQVDINKSKNKQMENSLDSEYSFGNQKNYKESNQRETTKIDDLNMEIQCLKASIEGLLDENKKLKRSFMTVFRLKNGQQISEELHKEVTIMKNILELNND